MAAYGVPDVVPNNSLEIAANSAEKHRSASVCDDEDGDTVMSSLDESEADDETYNDFIMPSHIIDEAAGLSQHRHGSPPQSFEEIVA